MLRIAKPFHVRLIGLTGLFGSGKSAVARRMRALGAHVIDCDRLVSEVYSRGHAVGKQVFRLFGKKSAQRSEIARVVFRNPKKKAQLEKLIHPYVFRRIQEKLHRLGHGCVVVEMPLLFEVGFERYADTVVFVEAKRSVILKRLRKKGIRPAEVRRRWKAQWPGKAKRDRADFVIDNSDGLSALHKAVESLWRLLQ
jgi:dephospho-CoA kinase